MSEADNNGVKNGTGDLDPLPNAADTHNTAHHDNNGVKDGTGDLYLLPNAADTHDAAHDRNIQDLVDLFLRQLSDQSEEKPFGVDMESGPELPDGVIPNGTIMGFCDKSFGVICADSRVTYQHENTSLVCDTAVKLVQVAPRIGMVGLGSQHIFSEVQRRIKHFTTDAAMASTMEDVVDCIVLMTTESVEECKSLYPDSTDLNVFFIVLGKMKEGCFEMYTLTNSHDSGCVVAKRAETRIVNGGSGHKALSTYQKEKEKPLGMWVIEGEAVSYCSKCMKHAVLEDKVHSGGDINMILITDEAYRSFVFRESDVYGYCPVPEERST